VGYVGARSSDIAPPRTAKPRLELLLTRTEFEWTGSLSRSVSRSEEVGGVFSCLEPARSDAKMLTDNELTTGNLGQMLDDPTYDLWSAEQEELEPWGRGCLTWAR
jgi:hypothetical protein